LNTLEMFLDLMRSAHGDKLLRMKGIVQIADDPDRPVVFHVVQHLMHPPTQLAAWPSEDRRTKLVVIGRGHDEKALIRFFETLVDGPARPPARRSWCGPAIAAEGFATMIAVLVLFHNSGLSKHMPQLFTQAMGGPK